ncbi:hypothetical protein A5672_12890 [Mycobacterium alsense]|uniref:PE domain-containing protein n=1 Tax=Mycobacterium alsense TaxID=324058 RepID=A0ABD6P5N2_9MYCO|nr:PE family protein [Mycobacterium alsense]OBG41078.1 hypothetical protein A5672_12890 [Mycobacterium alsense]
MSLLSVAPEIVAAASGDLANLGSALRSATAAAATQTTAVVAPAADQVSAAVAALLGAHGQEFQTINAQAAAFHDEFVSNLSAGAAQYANAEVANAQQMIGSGAGSIVGAAANPADVSLGGFPSISQNFNLGPFGISLSTTGASLGTGGFLGVSSAGVSLNTPFGSTPLLSANGIEAIYPNGQFLLSLGQTIPYVSYSSTMTGTLAPVIQISGLTLGVNNLLISFPGNYLGGLLPNVRFTG